MDIQTVLPLSVLWKLCCWTTSLPQRLKTWSLLQIYPFLIPFLLKCTNLQEYFSRKIYQTGLASPIHQTFCLLCGVQRDLLVYISPHKGKRFWTTTLIWVYFLQMTRQILTMKKIPKCFNQSNKLWTWKDTIPPIIYLIKYYHIGFGKKLNQEVHLHNLPHLPPQ